MSENLKEITITRENASDLKTCKSMHWCYYHDYDINLMLIYHLFVCGDWFCSLMDVARCIHRTQHQDCNVTKGIILFYKFYWEMIFCSYAHWYFIREIRVTDILLSVMHVKLKPRLCGQVRQQPPKNRSMRRYVDTKSSIRTSTWKYSKRDG